jgi:apolipoprotein N-acyltransferase
MRAVWAAAALALGAGAALAFAMPPWGWWPLAFIAAALLEIAVGDRGRRQRLGIGWAFGFGWMSMGIGWMWFLTAPGYLIATALFATMFALAIAITPSGPWRIIARPAALALAEAVRFAVPFGGVPLASVAISQAGGPIATVVRIVGPIGLAWVVLQIGTALGALVTERQAIAEGRRPQPVVSGAAASGLALLFIIASVTLAPQGTDIGSTLRVAAVQGGGEQGTSALEVPTWLVTERHLAATQSIGADAGVDLVLWPENTIRIRSGDFADSDVAADLGVEAARLDIPITVGITEDMPPTGTTRRFTNAQVVVEPDGTVSSRYDKVRRVPFGEYVPMRATFETLGVPIAQVPSDAVSGTAPAVIEIPAPGGATTTAGVMISWEVFFSDRLRDAVDNGGEVLLNPTNGASYTGTIVQTQQIASSQLRALEAGRWVVQAAPTGFSAFIAPDGSIIQRSTIGEQTVLIDEIERRNGLTWYMRFGDAPVLVMLIAAVAFPQMAATRRRRMRSDLDDDRDRAVVDDLDHHVGSESAGGHDSSAR